MLLILCRLLLLLAGITIAYQDFKSRLISIWVLIVFAFAGLATYIINYSSVQLIENAIFCAAYFLLLYLSLVLYFFIKTKKLNSLLDTHIGKGDLIMFMAIGITLEPNTLIYFFTATFIISILTWIPFRKRNTAVPLAGITVLCYLFFLTYEYLSSSQAQ